METMLSANEIVAGYQDRPVLHDVSVAIKNGESVLVIGPNGCGKTTLLKVLAGVLRPDHGQVLLGGADVTRVLGDKRVRMGLGYLMQTGNTFLSLTVKENLQLSFWHHDGNYADSLEFVLSIFPTLEPMLDRRAGLLSGGERQALAISMILMRRVEVLLLDEPTAGLSPIAAAGVLRAIHDAQLRSKFAILMVEHNLRLVHDWVSRVLVMNQGRIVAEEAAPSKLLDHEKLQGYYFG